MADAWKQTNRNKTSEDKTLDSDRYFLEKAGVNRQIQNVLTQIVENRPENPIAFLADYFENLGDKVNRVVKAHQQLCLTHYSRPAFHTNVIVAYDILSKNKTTSQKGLTGEAYTELLHMLCRDFPPVIKEKLLKKVQCREYEVVVFDVFRSGTFTCLVLQDYLKLADTLFKSLDLKGSGKADQRLCEVVTQQLTQAVSKTTANKPADVLEAGHMLGPEKLSQALNKAVSNKDKSVSITHDAFIVEIAEAFLQKVHTLR